MNYYFKPIKMTITKKKKSERKKCWQRCGDMGALVQSMPVEM